MTESLTKRFVDHRGISSAPQRVTEFPLDHRKRTLYVRTLVVMGQKFITFEHEKVVHLLPQAAALTHSLGCAVTAKSDERFTASGLNRVVVFETAIRFVSRHFGDGETFSRCFDEGSKKRAVISCLVANFNGSDDIGFDAAYDMGFDPISLFPHPAVLVIVPTGEPGSAEAGRVNSEIDFHTCQRQTALLNQVPQNGSQPLIFKIVEDGVVMRYAGDEPAIMRFAQIAHESAARECAVDLENCGEDGIRERQGWSTPTLSFRLLDTSAEIAQQFLEFVLLIRLSFVVSRPVLRISFPLGDGQSFADRRGTIRVLLMYDCVGHGKNVFAGLAAQFEIRTRASWVIPSKVNPVRAGAALRRNVPKQVICLCSLNKASGCNDLAAFFSDIHSVSSGRGVYY
jgi:hypothetical protein